MIGFSRELFDVVVVVPTALPAQVTSDSVRSRGCFGLIISSFKPCFEFGE